MAIAGFTYDAEVRFSAEDDPKAVTTTGSSSYRPTRPPVGRFASEPHGHDLAGHPGPAVHSAHVAPSDTSSTAC